MLLKYPYLIDNACLEWNKSHLALDPSHKVHNASDKYLTMRNFVTEMCTHVHISVTKWCNGGTEPVHSGIIHCCRGPGGAWWLVSWPVSSVWLFTLLTPPLNVAAQNPIHDQTSSLQYITCILLSSSLSLHSSSASVCHILPNRGHHIRYD